MFLFDIKTVTIIANNIIFNSFIYRSYPGNTLINILGNTATKQLSIMQSNKFFFRLPGCSKIFICKNSFLDKFILIKNLNQEDSSLFYNKYFSYNFSYKKDYYLPLLDKNYKYTPGLMCVSKQEYDSLKNPYQIMEASPYIKILKTMIAKILFVFYHPENVGLSLDKKFGMLFDITGIDLNKMPPLLSNKKIITVLQHGLAIVFPRKTFTYKELQYFADIINVNSYDNGEKLDILVFVEIFIAKQNLYKMFQNPYIIFYGVNPDNLHVIPGFSNIDSMEQTGQRNADIMIRVYNPITNTYKNIYIDIKTFSVSSFTKRRLMSIWFFNKRDYLIEFNNIKTTLEALINNMTDISKKIYYKRIYSKILEIKNNLQMNENQKMIEIHKILYNLLIIDDQVVSLNFPLSNLTSSFNNVLNNIMSRLQQHFPNDNLITVFPLTPNIDENTRIHFLITFIENHFQDDPILLEQIRLNIGLNVV